MFTLKVVVAGILLSAPHHHVRTTFSIPFETRYTCEEQLGQIDGSQNRFFWAAIKQQRRPMRPVAIKADCEDNGTSRI